MHSCPLYTSQRARRLYNVGSTSMQRHDVASTLRRRCINVMCLLGFLVLCLCCCCCFVYFCLFFVCVLLLCCCCWTHSFPRTRSDTFANKVDADDMALNEPSHLHLPCLSSIFLFLTNTLFVTISMFTFSDRRVHFRKSGMKGLNSTR